MFDGTSGRKSVANLLGIAEAICPLGRDCPMRCQGLEKLLNTGIDWWLLDQEGSDMFCGTSSRAMLHTPHLPCAPASLWAGRAWESVGNGAAPKGGHTPQAPGAPSTHALTPVSVTGTATRQGSCTSASPKPSGRLLQRLVVACLEQFPNSAGKTGRVSARWP